LCGTLCPHLEQGQQFGKVYQPFSLPLFSGGESIATILTIQEFLQTLLHTFW
jgi:hypothetical protein